MRIIAISTYISNLLTFVMPSAIGMLNTMVAPNMAPIISFTHLTFPFCHDFSKLLIRSGLGDAITEALITSFSSKLSTAASIPDCKELTGPVTI